MHACMYVYMYQGRRSPIRTRISRAYSVDSIFDLALLMFGEAIPGRNLYVMTTVKKKQSGKITSISNFYKPLSKQHPIFTANACSKIKNDDEQLKMINFLNDCPLFKNCEGGFQYDIALALNSANLKTLSGGVKYQILTSTPTDYIPKYFKFPPNNESPPGQCS